MAYACLVALLTDRKLLITGVLTPGSIAYSVAQAAQREGAEVVLTGFGRGLRITERVAKRLPAPADVLEMDVNRPEDIAAVAQDLDARWGRLDGVLHAIAFAPPDALGGRFLQTSGESAEVAFRTSAFSLKALAAGLLPLLEAAPGGASIVGLDFDASVAWPVYDWQGVAKAALESISRYLARDLGPRGIRSNLVAAGPLSTVAAQGIEGFDALAATWLQQAPLGWDLEDPSPVADACVFLLSSLARAITGEILHVDGGVHAVGAAAPASVAAAAVAPAPVPAPGGDQRNGSSEPAGHSPASSPHNRLA
jgi:enoyl-[acyl-carrier protein] reductase I